MSVNKTLKMMFSGLEFPFVSFLIISALVSCGLFQSLAYANSEKSRIDNNKKDSNTSVHVDINTSINRVFGSSPPMNYLLYALNPSKIVALNFNVKAIRSELIDDEFRRKPVVGSFHGGGSSINLEMLLSLKPQLIVHWKDDFIAELVDTHIRKTGIPTISVSFREITAMPEAMRIVGRAINETKRAEVLASYSEAIIRSVQQRSAARHPVRYYYAEGVDGLSTECDQSFHVRAMNFSGGSNVHKCRQGGLLGLERINFETLLNYDPEVIIVQPSVLTDIRKEQLWQQLRAVKNQKVYTVPKDPFNWLDRPPSFMRVMGIQWLEQIFYPTTTVDITQKTIEFYALFFNRYLTVEQAKEILGDVQ